jgi:hypothetical protein
MVVVLKPGFIGYVPINVYPRETQAYPGFVRLCSEYLAPGWGLFIYDARDFCKQFCFVYFVKNFHPQSGDVEKINLKKIPGGANVPWVDIDRCINPLSKSSNPTAAGWTAWCCLSIIGTRNQHRLNN